MRYCHQCAEPLEAGDNYCSSCRTPVRGAATTSPTGAPSHTAAPSPGTRPLKWSKVIITILLFLIVALGRAYSAELGEWMESIFAR
jgi:hypothetical protein